MTKVQGCCMPMLATMSVSACAFGFTPCGPPWGEAHGDIAGRHVLRPNAQHRVDAQLLRVGDFRLERCGAEIRIHANHVRAESARDSSLFGRDGPDIVDQRVVVVERDAAHLIRREPQREIAPISRLKFGCGLSNRLKHL